MSIQESFNSLDKLYLELIASIDKHEFEETSHYVAEWVNTIKTLVNSLSSEQHALYEKALLSLVNQHHEIQKQVTELRAKSLTQLHCLQHANAVKMHYDSIS